MRRQRPRLKKLKKVLMENPYDGPAVGMQEEAPGPKVHHCCLERVSTQVVACTQNMCDLGVFGSTFT